MQACDLLWEQWRQQVKELFPSLHRYQQDTLALVVQGLVQSGNAVMQRVAEEMWESWSRPTKAVSYERRLQRFVANERIEVSTCWKTFLEKVLVVWDRQPVTLVLDLTPYTNQMTIVYVGILLQSRVLPVAWEVMPQQESWEQGLWAIVERLFEQVASVLRSPDCTMLADRGLSCVSLMQMCEKRGWHYVLRIKQGEWMRRKFRHLHRLWEQGSQVIKQAGEHWYGKVLLWQEHEVECWLSACWEAGHEEAWFVISDRKASAHRLREYARRMRVESTFQDHKSRGCFIECSRFRDREHLTRWLLAVYLAQWWTAHLASSCIHHGQREQVDRTDRRDKGLFRIGRLWLKAILKKAACALSATTLSRVKAQLANCLPFSHRNQRLFFSLYLH